MGKKVFGIYLPYHKDEFLEPTDEEYEDMPPFPKQFRRVRIYGTSYEQMTAYPNIMCPASQAFECDESEVDAVVADFDSKFADEKWLEDYVYPFI